MLDLNSKIRKLISETDYTACVLLKEFVDKLFNLLTEDSKAQTEEEVKFRTKLLDKLKEEESRNP